MPVITEYEQELPCTEDFQGLTWGSHCVKYCLRMIRFSLALTAHKVVVIIPSLWGTKLGKIR